VQTKAGVRETRFFFPHDTETAPWWQGEDARLGSLAFAARAGAALFADDPGFAARLRAYAQDQLDWVLGRNPFDASLLEGAGHNNPEYRFLDSFEYTNAPGGIVNGITSGFTDPQGIDFNLPHTATGGDNDWRWGEQWLPHATWYLLALAAGEAPARPADGRVIIGYVFAQDRVLDPATIAADKLTHINYAFANIKDGRVVEGFANDDANYRVLTSLRQRNPNLKILVSVGGWTWSKDFSDAVLTKESRAKFVESAVDFVRRHDLDGFDVDWEYPGLPGDGNVNRPQDKQNFSTAMAELRTALDKEGAARGRHLLLTFAAGASSNFLEHTEMDVVQASVDYVNLMTYDFREAEWEPQAGHHSNLYTHPDDPHHMSADRAVREFLAAGVPARKLVLGVPFYGRAWGDVDPAGGRALSRRQAAAERIQTRYGNLAAWPRSPDGSRSGTRSPRPRSSGTRSGASSWASTTRSRCASSPATSASTASRARCSGSTAPTPTGALLGALYDGLRGAGATP
jgi:chitinase